MPFYAMNGAEKVLWYLLFFVVSGAVTAVGFSIVHLGSGDLVADILENIVTYIVIWVSCYIGAILIFKLGGRIKP